jgi:hypothetical protein
MGTGKGRKVDKESLRGYEGFKGSSGQGSAKCGVANAE